MEKVNPPQGLKRNILLGVAREEVRRAKVYFSIALIALPVSLVGVFLSGKYLVNSFYESGFYNYFSLLFSKDSGLLLYWKELTYSLVETVPVFGMTLFLIALGFLVWSGANTLTNMRRLAISIN